MLPASSHKLTYFLYDKPFNINSDVTCSFNFAMSGADNNAQGCLSVFFCVYSLTGYALSGGIVSGNHGIDGGITGSDAAGGILLENSSTVIGEESFVLYELGDYIELEDTVSGGPPLPGFLAGVTFDSTGTYGLSTDYRGGIHANDIITNALAVRSARGIGLRRYEECPFTILNTGKTYYTIRTRLGNLGRKLAVSYKPMESAEYTDIDDTVIPDTPYVTVDNNTRVKVGFVFTSPVSSLALSSNGYSDLYIKDFHVEGSILTGADLTTTTTFPTPLSVYNYTYYLTATPVIEAVGSIGRSKYTIWPQTTARRIECEEVVEQDIDDVIEKYTQVIKCSPSTRQTRVQRSTTNYESCVDPEIEGEPTNSSYSDSFNITTDITCFTNSMLTRSGSAINTYV